MSSGSPSSARRRRPPGARWSPPRRSLRSARTTAPAARARWRGPGPARAPDRSGGSRTRPPRRDRALEERGQLVLAPRPRPGIAEAAVVQGEGQGLALGEPDDGPRLAVPERQVDRGPQREAVGAAAGDEPAWDDLEQRDDEPVLRPGHEPDLDLGRPLEAPDPPEQQVLGGPAEGVRVGVLARGHGLGEDGDTRRSPEGRLQDEGALEVAPLGCDLVAGRPDPPHAGLGPEQPPDDRRTVEPREREPLHGPVAVDERGGVAVRQQGEVTDRGRRHLYLRGGPR